MRVSATGMIALDVERLEFARRAAGEGDDASFGRRVIRHAGISSQCRSRRNVHDLSRAPLLHEAVHHLDRAVKRAVQMSPDGVFPLPRPNLEQRRGPDHAGVVDHRLGEPANFLVMANVEQPAVRLCTAGLRTGLPRLPDRVLEGVLVAMADQKNARPFACEGLRDGAAYAAAGASDQGDPA